MYYQTSETLVEHNLADVLGMNMNEYDLWKETVQMESIQKPKHVDRWVSENHDNST